MGTASTRAVELEGSPSRTVMTIVVDHKAEARIVPPGVATDLLEVSTTLVVVTYAVYDPVQSSTERLAVERNGRANSLSDRSIAFPTLLLPRYEVADVPERVGLNPGS